jgi:hypothetical protein
MNSHDECRCGGGAVDGSVLERVVAATGCREVNESHDSIRAGRSPVCALAVAAGIVALVLAMVQAAHAGPPYETDDPEPLPYHTGEAYLFTSGSRAGDGTEIDAAPGVELNYSLLRNTFVHLVVPLAHVDPDGAGSAYGMGDVELGFKWRFIEQTTWLPDVAIFPFVEVPTGSRRRGLGTGHPQVYLPLWFQKDWGPWTVDGGGGYWINPGSGNRDWWFSGVLFQRQMTERLSLGGELVHETADTVGGSDGTGFNLGGIFTLADPYQILFSAGRNLENTAANRFSFYVALYRTF